MCGKGRRIAIYLDDRVSSRKATDTFKQRVFPKVFQHRAGDGHRHSVIFQRTDSDELSRGFHRQWLKGQCVQQAENCGVCADTEGERHDRGNCERQIFSQDSRRERNVATNFFKRRERPELRNCFFQRGSISELPLCCPRCFFGRNTLGE
jgi:hypothetical protein